MFKRFLYIFLFLLAGVAAFAQQYPVQGSLAIASPYPANLSDYANSNIQSLALNLTLTDLTMANKRVRLKVFIQTQNATIAQSIDNISGEPLIILDGGIPQRFTNAELAHYFRLENLQGINPDGYARSLPEGVYTIGFEVYDYFTGNKLSGRIAQTFWIIINDPPLLNSPTDKSKIADFTSGSGGNGGIIFNWTPRSSQVTNTEYEFTLSELWDAAGDPYQQFMSAIPKYQTTVSNTTTLIYNQAQPSLISGYTYAWRVRAKAKAGFEDVGLYRNDGYSNLFTFRYGDPCPAPQSLALEAKTSDAIAATWDAPIGATTGGIRYKIAYRKYSAAGQWSWAETETSDLFRTISGLEPATEYELKVGVPCNQTNEVVYTPSQRATTMAAGQISGIECGKEPTIDLSKQTLLTLLKAGDVVMANDFPTTISSVTGTSQGWSGEAWTKVPWLGDTRIHVTYASIKVNSDYKLIDGSFITTYDPTGKNIGDIDKTIDDAVGLYTGGTDVGKVVTGDAATTYTVPYTITPADTVGSTFTTNTTGGGTITLGNGQTLTVSNLPTTVQDAAGTVYQADDKGKLTKVGANSSNAGAMLATANLTVVDASKGTVTFAPTSDMKYAFDAWQKAYDANSAWSKRYETLPISGQSGKYRVSSKLMVPGEADKVLAIINLNNKKLVADSVRFVNAKGTLFERKKITDNSYELSLVGGPAGDAQEVYALYSTGGKTYTLGKLMVATYEPKTINLALVPVNDAPLDSKAIAAELKKVYEPLGINFNLTPKDNFKYKALETASLKVEGSGLLSVYTEQMKALNAAFVAKGEYDKNTIYLFAIDQPESQDGKSIEGVMPRGQQFGYMFVKGKDGDAQGLTATHEIGHGVFQLQHAFDYSGIKQKAITPLNVMDYPAGEALSKLQWDLMHDPGLVISVFETDKGVEKINATYNYLLPSHKPFRFKAGDGNLDDDCIVVNPPTNGNYPNGTLYSFVIGNTEYFYKSEDENFHSTDGKLYENAYTPSSAGNEFRLIAQDATDKCAYYLVKRLLKTSNYSTPDLSITTDAKKYYLCTKGKIPLNGNQSVNAKESALGNIIVYDYSTGKNDKEFFTAAQKQELTTQLPKYAQSLGVKVNVYLLNTENPNYNQALAKANADTENKVIFKLNEAQQSFNLDYRLGVPSWLKDVLPNTTDDCLPAYVNTRLDEIHRSSKYQEANTLKRIQLEYFTVLYHGTFGFLYCSFGEQAVANRSDKVQFVAGVCHELLACVDVVSIVGGINNLIDGANAAIHQTNTDFYNDIKQTVLDVLGGKEIADDELLRRITPPGIRQSQLLKQNVTKMSEQMVKLYFTDCKNLCAYRKGQFSIIILPAIITGGEWAMVRSGELLSRLKTISTLGKTEEVANLLIDAEKAGKTIVRDGEKLVVKDGDEVVRIIQKSNSEISIIRQLRTKPSYLPDRIITSSPTKTTTFIGKWQGELQKLYNELTSVNGVAGLSETDLNIYMQSGRFDHAGGFNMLSIEEWNTKVVPEATQKGIKEGTKAFDDFIWETYNKPWLESALQRGDDIIIWSNPSLNSNLYKPFKDIPSGPTFLNREIEFIKANATKYGYDFNKGIDSGFFSK